MNRLNSKRNDNRRGFTVVELVVAMAIIVIVSATAIGLINMQNNIYLRTTQTAEATNMAENAVECFRFVKNNSDANFEELFEKTGYDLEYDENTNTYITETSSMTVTITINGNTLEFNAQDGDKEILSKSYTCTK